jgi:hypothetical protein
MSDKAQVKALAEAERYARDIERFTSLNVRKQVAATLRAQAARIAELEAENRTIINAATSDDALTGKRTANRLVKIIAAQAKTARADALREAITATVSVSSGHPEGAAGDEALRMAQQAIYALIEGESHE